LLFNFTGLTDKLNLAEDVKKDVEEIKRYVFKREA